MKSSISVLVLILLFVNDVFSDCVCNDQATKCSCCITPWGNSDNTFIIEKNSNNDNSRTSRINGKINQPSISTNVSRISLPIFNTACVNITVDDSIINVVQIYGGAVVNTFSPVQDVPLTMVSNCYANQLIGWCLLLTNFSSNGNFTSGNLTSVFSAGNALTTVSIVMQQGVFSVVDPSSSSEESLRTRSPSDQCQRSCPPKGGCDKTSSYCCSDTTAPDSAQVCASLNGVLDVKILHTLLFVDGTDWLTATMSGDNPTTSCAIHPDFDGKYVCLDIAALQYQGKSAKGNVAITITTDGVTQNVALGNFNMKS